MLINMLFAICLNSQEAVHGTKPLSEKTSLPMESPSIKGNSQNIGFQKIANELTWTEYVPALPSSMHLNLDDH